jgi:glycosyltransferase involved in cell wall biosynthesis
MTERKRPKLLFLVTEDWYFCSHRLPLALGAQAAGFDVVVASRVNRHGPIIESYGLRLVPLTITRRGKNPFKELGAIARIASVYRREAPDIVHHVALKPVIYGSIAARISNVPVVVNAVAGLGYLFVSRNLVARIARFFVQYAYRFLLNLSKGKVVVQNDDDRALLTRVARLASDQTVLIRGSGVDMDVFSVQPEPEGPVTVVLASRMLWDKGVGEFVAAARSLRSVDTSIRFVLVGESDPDNPASISNDQLSAWLRDGAVEWWGRRDDMPEVFAASHVVCLPSYREGLPKVLIEAAACGRPIVTTDVPGCREVVRHGENGLLVPARDSRSLADALRQLIENAPMRRVMGQRGREIVETEFSEHKVVRETLQVYGELLA